MDQQQIQNQKQDEKQQQQQSQSQQQQSQSKNLSVLGSTSLFLAAARAILTEEGKIDDPFAKYFAECDDKLGYKHLDLMASNLNVTKEDLFKYLLFRVKFYDNQIKEIIQSDHEIKQLVILAIGCDTRPYRLDCFSQDFTIFQHDRQDVQDLRTQILAQCKAQEKCKNVRITNDLREEQWDESFIQQGYDPTVKSIWMAEGLISYLTVEQTIELLNKINKISAPGSYLFCNMNNDKSNLTKKMNEFWVSNSITGFSRPDQLLEKTGYTKNVKIIVLDPVIKTFQEYLQLLEQNDEKAINLRSFFISASKN